MNEDHPEKVSLEDSEDLAPEDSEWVSVGDLLRRTCSPGSVPAAHLATAIEKFDCYEIDRFGRRIITGAKETVLNRVAQWIELIDSTPDGLHPDTDPDWILEALDRFGWPRANLPDFDSMKPGAEEPLGDTERHRMQRTIVALVVVLAKTKNGDKYRKSNGPNINNIVQDIQRDIRDKTTLEVPTGYGISTFSKVISEALSASLEELNITW